jgi:integrating conjugative element protein (TIGR03757 family)
MSAPPPALVGFLLIGPLLISSPQLAAEPDYVDVFTEREHPIRGADHSRLKSARVQIYEVDGLRRFEAALSEGLPGDPDAAKAEALRRIGALNEAQNATAQNAANGLAMALHYGVDRIPAIVIDGTAVVYGVTDLVDAVQRYDTWRAAPSR